MTSESTDRRPTRVLSEAQAAPTGRVMIAGVGYTNLRDLSVGPYLVPELAEMEWPPAVEVDDWSYRPIAVMDRLRQWPGYYRRVVFISAAERGREPGRVYCRRWIGELPDAEEIQARVGEAVTGVISLDNLLIIAEYFKCLPPETFVVEVEPIETDWGPDFSPRVRDLLPEVLATVRRVALDE
ncbi:MAG: hydrogenase maturation protease [Chloroflexota bacterium]